jgi:hypothetical protein
MFNIYYIRYIYILINIEYNINTHIYNTKNTVFLYTQLSNKISILSL